MRPRADPPRSPRSSGRSLPSELRPVVERIGPPLARTRWSPDFAVQTLEVLPVFAGEQGLTWLKPVHAPSLQYGLPQGVTPADSVLEIIGSYPLTARVVHSTSWRHDNGRIVLTYLVVVDAPAALPSHSLEPLVVERTGLARGGASSAPTAIGVAAVLEHALRHLRWLIGDDVAVATALPGWASLLDGYQPEPFAGL